MPMNLALEAFEIEKSSIKWNEDLKAIKSHKI